MKYNKLVRDKIPEIIEKDGKTPIIHIAQEKEYKQKLVEKLQEEVDEFAENDSPEELADILEIVYAICDTMEVDKEKLEGIREKKAQERGGFKNRIILDEVKD